MSMVILLLTTIVSKLSAIIPFPDSRGHLDEIHIAKGQWARQPPGWWSSPSTAGPCLPFVQLGELSQLNYGGDGGDGGDDDIDGEEDDNCTREGSNLYGKLTSVTVVGLLLIVK